MVEIAVTKYHGEEKFDRKTMSGTFLTFGLVIFSEHFAPAEYFTFYLWWSQAIWFFFFPYAYLDDEGYARPGWPTAIARTRDFMNILIFNTEPFLSNPKGEKLSLTIYDFFQMMLISVVNMMYSSFNTMLFDLPYVLNFAYVLFVYVFFP